MFCLTVILTDFPSLKCHVNTVHVSGSICSIGFCRRLTNFISRLFFQTLYGTCSSLMLFVIQVQSGGQ